MYTHIIPAVKFINTLCLPANANCLLLWLLVLVLSGHDTFAAQNYQQSLSDMEIELATSLALRHHGQSAVTEPVAERGRDRNLATVQILLIEAKEQKRSAPAQRLADVFLYNYALQSTVYMVVDLTSSHVVQESQLLTQHLPLNSTERRYAARVAQADHLVNQLIQAEWDQQSTGSLQSKVSIFEPAFLDDNMAEVCTRQRCAQLTFTTSERLSLSVEPIVVMATGEVVVRGESTP